MYNVNLIRERRSEDEIWVDSFFAEDHVLDPEKAIRDAVAEYLNTEDGKASLAYTCNDFNWGDVVVYVPKEIWNKHGLKFNDVKTVEIKVNQDEVLCKENNHEEG